VHACLSIVFGLVLEVPLNVWLDNESEHLENMFYRLACHLRSYEDSLQPMDARSGNAFALHGEHELVQAVGFSTN